MEKNMKINSILNRDSIKKKIKKEKKTLECFCGKKYKNKSSYNNHRRIKHDDDNDSILKEKKKKKIIKIKFSQYKIFCNRF